MSSNSEPRFYIPHPVFDTHFHALHVREHGIDLDEILTKAFSTGLVGAVEVAVNELFFDKRQALSGKYSRLFLSAGIHPSSTNPDDGIWRERFSRVIEQSACSDVVAIGETGLDFFRNYAPQKLQEKAFRDHLELAAETGLPIIIHNREADERVLSLVKDSRCRHGIFHCFSSGWETARQALDLGFHISFAGNLTYRKTEDIQDTAVRVPSNRILIETDSPYLSPQSVRGRLNHPGHIGYTLERLAEIRGVDIAALAVTTVENSRRLFGTCT